MQQQDYYAEQALKELQRRKEHAEAFAEAWGGVQRKKTKDGKDFAVMANNFKTKDGEKCIFNTPYGIRGERQIKITVHTDKSGYEDDWLDITPCVPTYSERRKEYEEAGRIIDGGAYLVDYVELNADEIEELVANRTEYYKECVKEYQKAIDDFNKITEKILALREQESELLKNVPKGTEFIFGHVLRSENQ